MAEIEITISTSDDRFFNALEHPEGFADIMAVKVEEVAGALVGELEQYPSETEANAPGRFSVKSHRAMGFYERGRGWWYPVMTLSPLGKTGWVGIRHLTYAASQARIGIKTKAILTKGLGKKLTGAAGYKLRQTSEQLGENWAIVVSKSSGEAVAHIGNLSTYAGYVQGYDQTPVLRKYGWQTIEDVLLSPFFMEVARARELEALTMYYHLGGLG